MVKCSIRGLSVWFGRTQALRNISLDIEGNEILTIIGPAGSGKTTLLRMLNRLGEIHGGFRKIGEIRLDGVDVDRLAVGELRRRVGMVFALPAPLPLSIFENVAYGVRMHARRSRRELGPLVESALRQAYLWDEVKDRLDLSAFVLSGGQQQRLCIARSLAVQPEMILFDEPCSGLDPISTAKVEEAMQRLKDRYTMVLVTNNVKQAARVGDRTAFFLTGDMVEVDRTDRMFTSPSDPRTADYIQGRFG